MSPSDLTNGERLYLARFREGVGQKVAASWYGVGLYTYRLWEDDQEAETTSFEPPALGRITEAEEYVIRRRRSGLTVAQVCEKMGVSRWWLRQMETGSAPIDRLRSYWEARAA